MSDDMSDEARLAREERMRAIRDELLQRRHERESGPVLLVEILEPQGAPLADGTYAVRPPHIPAPASLRGRRITRFCMPASPHMPGQAPGLFRVEARGLVRLSTEASR